MLKFNLFIFLIFIFSSPYLGAEPWKGHKSDIEDLERDIYKYEQELQFLVDSKKKTRERARIEQTLQRIVEIHAELISLRKRMDNIREHLKTEHPDFAHVLDDYDSRMLRYQTEKGGRRRSPLSKDLDQLLIKVQLKFSSFVRTEQRKQEMVEVDKVIEGKMKDKKEREADVYLRGRSKVKLVK